jgi:hypothetical protein
MGKGLAKAFKEREPRMFAAYKRLCETKSLQPGKLWLWRGDNGWVLNFPTKIHWRNPSNIEWIEEGLRKFVQKYQEHGISEISFPRLGCGNGGLDWNHVRPLMERYLSPLQIPVYIHDYEKDIGLPEHMELVAEKVKQYHPGSSFDDFMASLREIVSLSQHKMNELGGDRSFFTNMDEGGLSIAVDDNLWRFENEDLRGVWFDLQNGLVTKEKAGLAGRGAGKALLTMLSLLPNTRPIEIKRFGADKAEFAVELSPSALGLAPTKPAPKQHALAWH